MAELADIFAFEETLSAAFKALIERVDGDLASYIFVPAVDNQSQGTSADVTVPRIEIAVMLEGNTDHTVADKRSTEERIYGAHEATIEISVFTYRLTEREGTVPAGFTHKKLRGKVRQAVHTAERAFWTTNTPNYQFQYIRELQPEYDHDEEHLIDITRLTFEAVFRVDVSEWPDTYPGD